MKNKIMENFYGPGQLDKGGVEFEKQRKDNERMNKKLKEKESMLFCENCEKEVETYEMAINEYYAVHCSVCNQLLRED